MSSPFSRQVAGTKNPNVKFSPELVRKIRVSKLSCFKLAIMLNTSPSHIWRIKHKVAWSCLE